MKSVSHGLVCIQNCLSTFTGTGKITWLKFAKRNHYRSLGLFMSMRNIQTACHQRIVCLNTCDGRRYKHTSVSGELRLVSPEFLGQTCDRSYKAPKNWTTICTPVSLFSTSNAHFSANSGILKNQAVLQLKRPARKKVPKILDEEKTIQINNVVAYAIAEDIDLSGLEKHLEKQGLYTIGKLPQDVTSALHVRGKYNVEQKPKEIFVFEDGSVVFWCVPEVERGAFLKMLAKYADTNYASSLVLYEREEMDFTFVNGKTSLAGDIIQLDQRERDGIQVLLELYTFSNALAQSVKLAIWEAMFNKFITSIESVTEDLRHGHKISMSRRQVLMKTGELFSLRHLINLSSDLLDTPDFYWDREVLEPLYLSLCSYLNISRRTRVMNEKLNHCCELTELLSSQLNDAHHTRLEVMIIVLILVEVVFEIIHFAERYWDEKEAEILDSASRDSDNTNEQTAVHQSS